MRDLGEPATAAPCSGVQRRFVLPLGCGCSRCIRFKPTLNPRPSTSTFPSSTSHPELAFNKSPGPTLFKEIGPGFFHHALFCGPPHFQAEALPFLSGEAPCRALEGVEPWRG
jgi:hypothetical protein